MSSNTLQVLKAPKQKTKRIVVSEINYNKLAEQGKVNETFNDVITRILTSQKDQRGD